MGFRNWDHKLHDQGIHCNLRTGRIKHILLVCFWALALCGCSGLGSSSFLTSQPNGQTVTIGQRATFSVKALGSPVPHYQWLKDGKIISGATSSSYTTQPASMSDGGIFRVVVTRGVESLESRPITLRVVDNRRMLVTISPENTTIRVGSAQSFSALINGTVSNEVRWSVSGAGCVSVACGTISTDGVYVAPIKVPSPPTILVRAVSMKDPRKSASSTAVILTAVAAFLTVNPVTASVQTAGMQPLTANFEGTSDKAVVWSVKGAGCADSACGIISSSLLSGVYLAPLVAPNPPIVTVTATSISNPALSSSASIKVVPVIAVNVTPAVSSVAVGATQQFSASVSGTSNTKVTWSISGPGCSGSACGAIDQQSGRYTAPSVLPSSGIVAVKATTLATPMVTSAVEVNILQKSVPSDGQVDLAKKQPMLPTLPQATVDLHIPQQVGKSWNVPAGDSRALQSSIDDANCGDTIMLPAGATYVGNFKIPAKSCDGWIIIQSSDVSHLPAGIRVGPSSTPSLATISSGITGIPPIKFQASAHNWRLIGLEITTTVGVTQNALIETDIGAKSLAQLPSYIIVNRCYVHGGATTSVRRGIGFQVAFGAVVDSYFSELHQKGSDSQAIAIWNGAGPFLIQNNFLSAASENMLFGGADPGIAELVPSDITIRGNHFWKNYATWKGAGWGIKNLLEFKNAQRVLVDGNVFEYSWAEGQVGVAILVTPRNQDGHCKWCVVQDVTITHNLIRHAATGIETAASDDNNISLPTQRILISNNVLTDISSKYGGNGWAFETICANTNASRTSAHDIVIDHNTAFAENTLLYLGDSGITLNYQFTNNIGGYGRYAIFGNASGVGALPLRRYVPNAIYDKIVLLTSNSQSDGGKWPDGTLWNSVKRAQFTDYPEGDYQLLATSPYHNAGSDGKDIGVWDWEIFKEATTNATGGAYPY